ncbi:Bax inhibitor-1/YccA family protein [Tsukamurella sp. 8F]|uniref:Bax inhibitor-1/YccA family protein n=1 Tax=unclassified Tsukamurella TaxID=2633480 RepID=UPI0023B8C88B|nr:MULTISPECIES: Bax inhibitor-1/YccA family protein [unclassified Tsukamurella]MDF0530180.1 Bax inhibitor-1/YccA family protein [Tsukamurella sp. 8J]MDF0586497.1 Bax inhibitor-1/YccA family protein [Tsukamurella sp. 8F]
MRESSNPVLRNLMRGGRQKQQVGGPQAGYQQPGYPGQQGQQNFGGAGFGSGAAGMAQGMQFQQPYQTPQQPYAQQQGVRSITIDDVVQKTAMTLGVLIVFAVASYFAIGQNLALANPLLIAGAIGGLVLVMVATFARKSDNPGIVLGYAAFEGLFVGAISYVFANFMVSGVSAGALIAQAVLGTVGVFIGMLVVYKTGAIRVTPRFTRMLFAAMIGVVVLALGNLVMSLFTHGAGPLRDGGPIAIIFSLVCIGIAAFSFLIDFDQADQLIRAGAPAKAAWGVALGLTVTLVWLYVEILRLLSYFYRSN